MTVRSAATAAVLILSMALPASTVAARTRLAVVVGSNVGQAGEQPLRYSERDAGRFRDVLVDLGGVAPRDAELLLGPGAREVDAALDRMFARLMALGDEGRHAEVFFFFAGHGDAASLHLGRDVLSRKAVEERLRAMPAGLRIAVVDSCRTADVGRPRGVRAAAPFDVGEVAGSSQEGLVVVQSSRDGEAAQESDALQGAVFTHYLVSAMRGAGDADRDGRVTLIEAYSLAYRRTVLRSAEASAAVQHPSFELDLAGSGDLVLTELQRSDAFLVIPPADEARVLVYRQPSGVVVAEAIGSSGSPLVLAVPSGRLLVQRRAGDRLHVAQVDLPYGGRHVLSSRDFTDVPYEVAIRRGGTLDPHPDTIGIEAEVRGDRLPGAWVPRYGGRATWTRTFPGQWTLGAVIGAAGSVIRRSGWDTREALAGLGVRAGGAWPVGVTTVEVAGGPEVEVVFQHRQRLDADRLILAGMAAPERSGASLAAGAGIDATWRVPLAGRWSLHARVRASLLARDVADGGGASWRAVPVVGGAIGAAWRF